MLAASEQQAAGICDLQAQHVSPYPGGGPENYWRTASPQKVYFAMLLQMPATPHLYFLATNTLQGSAREYSPLLPTGVGGTQSEEENHSAVASLPQLLVRQQWEQERN